MKSTVMKILGLRPEMGIGFYLRDFWFRIILRNNAATSWAVHFTSTIIEPQKIIRGKHVYPGDSPGNYIQAIHGIEIGDYTNIGPNVGIISANHDPYNNEKHLPSNPIIIGKHCWIGMGAVILPGVQLGDYTIVGANAVVTHSFENGYCVIAGNPAKIIRQLPPNNTHGSTPHHGQ
jgi:acetyltransferase-like isoleucine patch superfamily enzyme